MCEEVTRLVVGELFRLVGTGAPLQEIAALYSEDVDFCIAGDTAHVPWAGHKTGRQSIIDFFGQIREEIISERFDVTDTLYGAGRAVVLGSLASRVKRTGKLIETAFAFDIVVKDGLITRYHMLEDSFAVSRAMQ